jgi:hypothetical protein
MNIELDTGVQKCLGPKLISNPDLIYVCVTIASPGDRDRFFVLTKTDLQKVCIDSYCGWMDSIQWKRPRNPESYDCRYYVHGIFRFEDNWELITHRLQTTAPDVSLVPSDH